MRLMVKLKSREIGGRRGRGRSEIIERIDDTRLEQPYPKHVHLYIQYGSAQILVEPDRLEYDFMVMLMGNAAKLL